MKEELVIILSPPDPKYLTIDNKWPLKEVLNSIPGFIVDLRWYLDGQDITLAPTSLDAIRRTQRERVQNNFVFRNFRGGDVFQTTG